MSTLARVARVAAVAAVVLAAAVPAHAASAPDLGRPFAPAPASAPLYAVQGPGTDPARQRHVVTAPDGARILVETWLPAARDGHVPPARVPVVLHFSPYLSPGAAGSAALDMLVRRGYAFAQAHVPGTGGSTGCFEQTADAEQAAGARVVHWLGTQASFSSGRVATFGLSYAGGAALSLAASPERDLVAPLKAVIALSPGASLYDFFHHDGVPHLGQSVASTLYDLVNNSFVTGLPGATDDVVARLACQPEALAAITNLSGDMTPYYAARDLGRQVHRITAPTLMAHGHADRRVSPHVQAGLFDRLPETTPKAGLFGVWDHEPPHRQTFNGASYESPRLDWERPDFEPMLVAWLDRWLKDLPTGVEEWPVAQVQGTDGQWRAEPDWPRTGGPTGRLALSGATLGARWPWGSSTYLESLPELEGAGHLPGTAVTFTTPPLPGRLELTGSPVLDARISLSVLDAHLAAKLEALDAAGRPTLREARTVGMRSMRHLAPLVHDRFAQARGVAPPVLRPVPVQLRFNPTSLVVPKGGRLRLTIAGSVIAYDGLDGTAEGLGAIFQGPSQPSLLFPLVTVHHSCAAPSMLRFTMPRAQPDLLNVREEDEPAGPVADNRPFAAPRSDGGGLATAPVC